MSNFWAIQRISTGKIVRRFKQNSPSKPLDPDLKLLPVTHSKYPPIDIDTQGIGYKEEIIAGILQVTYLPFDTKDGPLIPIEIEIEKI